MAEKSNSNVMKNVVMIVFIVAACGFVWMQLQKRALIKQESQAVEAYNAGNYDEAIKLFEELRDNAKGDAVKRHQTNLAKCYIGQAEAEGLSVADQLKFYQKAWECDDSAITDPAIRLLLEKSRQKQEAAATGADGEKQTEDEKTAE